MEKERLVRVALFWLGTTLLASTVHAESLTIPGSGNPEYVLGQLAGAFNKQQSLHHVTVPPSTGTAGAFRDVGDGTASLGRIGRPLKDAERSKGLTFVPIGRDAVVFVGGAKITVRNISSAQALEVFSGKITDWRELGGQPGPIRALGRETTDASRQVIGRNVPQFENIVYGENVKVVHLDPQLIEMLDRFPTSLGFINQSALFACKTKVVRLGFNGVEPTLKNLESGQYPMWVEFGFIHKAGELGPAGKAFLEFVKSAAGERILREHGVFPAPSPR